MKECPLDATGKKVVVQRHDAKETTTSTGIILPAESTVNRSPMATVHSVGSLVDEPKIKKGLTVVLKNNVGQEVTVGGQGYTFIHMDDILGIVKE